MPLKITDFDPANYLDDEQAIADYLTDALDTGDIAFIADALGVVSRAYGMTKIAKEAGLSRESLYRSLSVDGNPELATILGVMKALKMELKASPRKPNSYTPV